MPEYAIQRGDEIVGGIVLRSSSVSIGIPRLLHVDASPRNPAAIRMPDDFSA
jgi:hypothetical protein